VCVCEREGKRERERDSMSSDELTIGRIEGWEGTLLWGPACLAQVPPQVWAILPLGAFHLPSSTAPALKDSLCPVPTYSDTPTRSHTVDG
jgi:hypothetical protein